MAYLCGNIKFLFYDRRKKSSAFISVIEWPRILAYIPKGKQFYRQLMEQKFIAVSATKDKISVSLRGKVRNIGQKNLDIMFERNPYMKEIYPDDTRDVLEVFCIYEADGEYFDISVPSHINKDSFVIGKEKAKISGYYVQSGCIGCRLCYSVCPQKSIDISSVPAVIEQNRCLHCGRCAEICPKKVICYESE